MTNNTKELLYSPESRQTEMKGFPAHALQAEDKDNSYFTGVMTKHTRDSLVEEFSNLLRQYQKLREAVCVLEDEVSVEHGDVARNLVEPWKIEMASDEFLKFADLQYWKPIMRNSLPVVYQSALRETV